MLLFGFVFAVNCSVHSYLILAFGSAERITRDVGFYYMANPAGRRIGTLLSGLSYQVGGLPLCLTTAGVMALASCTQAQVRLSRNSAAVARTPTPAVSQIACKPQAANAAPKISGAAA